MKNKIDELINESRALRKEVETVLNINGIPYDLSEWITIKEYAKQYGLTGTNVVSNWIDRGVISKDDYLEIPELNSIRLVRNRSYR